MSGNWRQEGQKGVRSNYWDKSGHSPKRKYREQLDPGCMGFLCTCNDKFREKECAKDAHSILNEYADKLYGKEGQETSPEVKPNDDMDESLEAELATLRQQNQPSSNPSRFKTLDCGVNGIVFIKTTLPDPSGLVHFIVSDIADKKVQRSKWLLRLVPVQVTCKANITEIEKSANGLFEQHFTEGEKTFSIIFNHRYNDSIKRDTVIEVLAKKVVELNETNKVDLKNPNLAVMVEVLRKVCCISVIPDYFALKKYNIMELCLAKESVPGGKEENVEREGESAPDNAMGEESKD